MLVARSDDVARPIKHTGKWRIRPLDADGHRTSEVFDTYNDAAHALRQREIAREEIRSGRRRRPPPDRSFNDLCDYWLEHRAVQKRSEKHDKSIIRAHLRPAFGALRLCDLGVERADRFVNERKHLGEKTIGNILTLLITMLGVARDLGWLLDVPRIKKPKIKTSRAFGYLKTPAEVSRFLQAAQAEGPMIAALYATAVWTGMRAGDLACLEWTDVDWM